jgi:16S rRNA processing protein RimM
MMAEMLEVGRVARAHGLRGEVVVALTTDRTERVAPGTVLTTKKGDLVVETSRPHQGKWLVMFTGVTERSQAEALRGLVLSAPPLDLAEEADVLWVHELVGSVVATPDGTEHGTVVAVEPNPASDLLVLDDGRLVPLTFLVETSTGRLVVDVPEGLLDL